MARVELQHSASSIHSAKPMSRLEQMQAELQRKMLQEKEEKMVKLYNDNQSKAMEKVNSGGSNGRIGGGNVRKFFQDRRVHGDSVNLDSSLTSLDSYFLNSSNGLMASQRGLVRPKKSSPVGWDKSYPLVPIERTNSGSSSGYESISGQNKQFSTSGEPKKRTPHVRRQSLDRNRTTTAAETSAMRRSKSQIIDGSRTAYEPTSGKSSTTTSPTRGRPPPFRENRSMRDEEKRKMQLEMRRREQELVNKIKEQQAEIERMRQEKIKEEKAQKARLMRKPVPASVRPPASRVQPQESERSSPNSQSDETDSTPSIQSTPRKPVALPKKPPAKKPSPVVAAAKEKSPPPRRVTSSNSDLPECTICGRRFAADRLEKHVSVCKKTTSKKRKVFDPVKMRTQGTEQENFIKKGTHKKEPPKPKKSDWRKKHENFLQAIRQARQMSDHVAAGGKLSDLPPPPPLDTSDYIQCPHCGRKFSEGAAERHIPKCQSIRSNKK